MPTLEQEPIIQNPEAHKRSFDIVSSVNMMRHDLEMAGYVRGETEQRVYDEELTLVAEGIDRFSYTSFTLQEQDGQLVFFDRGEWRPYVGSLITGLNVAKEEAAEDGRREFLVDWATRDLEVGYKLQKLKPGEVLSWDNPFPEDQQGLYGDKFLMSVGLQPARKMGFIYRAQRNADGSVTLETHSVDNSDPDAFEASRTLCEWNPKATIQDRIAAQDAVMAGKHGEDFFAGRKLSEKASKENAWEFLEKNKSLVEFYMSEIRSLAESSLEGQELYKTKKALTIGVWARTKELLNEQTLGSGAVSRLRVYEDSAQHTQVAHQVQRALHRAIARQETMIGCGGGASTEGLLGMSPEDAFDAIFGSDSSKENTDNSEMECVNCPECKTFHEKVRKVNGRPVCDNADCKLHG